MKIGVDLGGTKIEALALDRSGREVFRKRVLTPRGDYTATLDAVVALVKEIGAGTVGVGIPGALSRMTGLVKNANSTWLIGRPLKHDLERALGREVRIENDANCFALAEAIDGARARRRHQQPRSGGHRAGRRHVQCAAALHRSAAPLGAPCVLRSRGDSTVAPRARRFERRARRGMALGRGNLGSPWPLWTLWP